MAQKALEAYQKYDDYVAKNPTTEEKVLARRKKALGYDFAGEEFVVHRRGELGRGDQDCRMTYIQYEAENPQPKSSVHIAYLNKFRALISQAATTPAPDSDKYLKDTLQAAARLPLTRAPTTTSFMFSC